MTSWRASAVGLKPSSTSESRLSRGCAEFKVKRTDQFNGPVRITAEGIPPGYVCSTPVTIQQNQYRAYATLFATADAPKLTDDQIKAIRFSATSQQLGTPLTLEIPGIKEFTLQETPKLRITMHQSSPAQNPTLDKAEGEDHPPKDDSNSPSPIVLSMQPGETIKAFLTLDRIAHNGVVSFGKEDAGRNLPHGVFVDNIGLNGLLLLQGQSEREFFVTASPVAEPGTYSFFLKSNVESVTSYPATLIIER